MLHLSVCRLAYANIHRHAQHCELTLASLRANQMLLSVPTPFTQFRGCSDIGSNAASLHLDARCMSSRTLSGGDSRHSKTKQGPSLPTGRKTCVAFANSNNSSSRDAGSLPAREVRGQHNSSSRRMHTRQVCTVVQSICGADQLCFWIWAVRQACEMQHGLGRSHAIVAALLCRPQSGAGCC